VSFVRTWPELLSCSTLLQSGDNTFEPLCPLLTPALSHQCHTADVKYSLGQAGVGAAGCCMCVVWLGMALLLGKRHAQLADHGGQHHPAPAGAHRL
jgi:hypothetical protein